MYKYDCPHVNMIILSLLMNTKIIRKCLLVKDSNSNVMSMNGKDDKHVSVRIFFYQFKLFSLNFEGVKGNSILKMYVCM